MFYTALYVRLEVIRLCDCREAAVLTTLCTSHISSASSRCTYTSCIAARCWSLIHAVEVQWELPLSFPMTLDVLLNIQEDTVLTSPTMPAELYRRLLES